jgi:hypothetical protein
MMRLFLHFSYIRGLPRGMLLASLFAIMLGWASLDAATLTVTTTADSGAGSLRDAITAASDGDTIQFDSALNGQTITLSSGELVIDQNITISGPGPGLLGVARTPTTPPPYLRIFSCHARSHCHNRRPYHQGRPGRWWCRRHLQ